MDLAVCASLKSLTVATMLLAGASFQQAFIRLRSAPRLSTLELLAGFEAAPAQDYRAGFAALVQLEHLRVNRYSDLRPFLQQAHSAPSLRLVSILIGTQGGPRFAVGTCRQVRQSLPSAIHFRVELTRWMTAGVVTSSALTEAEEAELRAIDPTGNNLSVVVNT
jgi:hypothetical protein